MSRCFPFPPPGYEKRGRSDEADALKKERQKEKKPKKEKKDKEKRDSKEKERDRSDEKRREKKDKKERHRDKKEKKKDGDRDKGKDKNGYYEEKRVSGIFGDPDKGESSNEKKIPGRYDPHSGEKVIQKERKNGADKNNTSGEKKIVGQFSAYGGVKLSENSFPAADVRDSKFMQDFQRRIRGEHVETGNKLLNKDAKMGEGMVRMSDATTRIVEEGMRMTKDKKGMEQKLEFPSIKDEARFSKNITVQISARMFPSSMPRPVEKDVDKILSNQKIKEKEADARMVPSGMPGLVDKDVEKGLNKEKIEEKQGDDKHSKDKEESKKGQRKDKVRDKEKKKEQTNKIKGQHKKSEKDTKALNKDDLLGTHNKQTSHPPADNNKDIIEQNARKRKDLVTNGFAHDIGTKPNKLPRLTSSSPLKEHNKRPDVNSSSHSLLGNSKVLKTNQTSSPIIADKPLATANSSHAIKKELKPNGAIASEALPTGKCSSSQFSQNPEVLKPPHPDSKYLNEVLLVPKMEDSCYEFDDQDWLFHSTSESDMPMVRSSCEDEIPHVWAEAMPIESVDICALPYVIPY